MKMATLASALKSEVRRVAASEIKKVLRPVRRLLKQVKTLKQVARDQRRNLASVEARMDRLKVRLALRRARGKGPRVSADSIRSFRSRVAMTREQFARLLGVSPGSGCVALDRAAGPAPIELRVLVAGAPDSVVEGEQVVLVEPA